MMAPAAPNRLHRWGTPATEPESVWPAKATTKTPRPDARTAAASMAGNAPPPAITPSGP